ncbi:MAG: DUF2062 domain-containing protein [Spirulina sp.]
MQHFSLTDPSARSRRHRHKSQSWWWRLGKLYYLRLLRLEGSPRAIARGIASGVFAGFIPVFGIQTLISLILAFCLRGNKLAAAAATWISNPVTYVPLYTLNFLVGRWLLGETEIALNQIDWTSPDMLEAGSDFALRLFVGGFVLGLIAAVFAYFLGLDFIRRYRRSRRRRGKNPQI